MDAMGKLKKVAGWEEGHIDGDGWDEGHSTPDDLSRGPSPALPSDVDNRGGPEKTATQKWEVRPNTRRYQGSITNYQRTFGVKSDNFDDFFVVVEALTADEAVQKFAEAKRLNPYYYFANKVGENPDTAMHKWRYATDSLAALERLAVGCPDNMPEGSPACEEWEANTEKYKDVVKDMHRQAMAGPDTVGRNWKNENDHMGNRWVWFDRVSNIGFAISELATMGGRGPFKYRLIVVLEDGTILRYLKEPTDPKPLFKIASKMFQSLVTHASGGTVFTGWSKMSKEARKQMLLPRSIASKIPKLYSQEDNPDPIAWVKFFNAYGRGTWLITEFDGRDRMFGLADLGHPELGYISLGELESLEKMPGLQMIERDTSFRPMPLSEAAKKEHVNWSPRSASMQTLQRLAGEKDIKITMGKLAGGSDWDAMLALQKMTGEIPGVPDGTGPRSGTPQCPMADSGDEILAEGCPDNLDESECDEWEANTEKYKDVVKEAGNSLQVGDKVKLTSAALRKVQGDKSVARKMIGVVTKLLNEGSYVAEVEWTGAPKGFPLTNGKYVERVRDNYVAKTATDKEAKVSPKSKAGTRVVMKANPVSRALYTNPPADGAEGTVTPVSIGGRKVTYMPGPGGGLLYVKWDDGESMGVSPNDLDAAPKGKTAAGTKKQVTDWMHVLSKDSAGGFIVTLGDPKKSSSKIEARFSDKDSAKMELKNWVDDNVGRKLSKNHIIDLTGQKLVPDTWDAAFIESLPDKQKKQLKLAAGDAMGVLRKMAAWKPPQINKTLAKEVAKVLGKNWAQTGVENLGDIRDALGKAVANPMSMADRVDNQAAIKAWKAGISKTDLHKMFRWVEEIKNGKANVQYRMTDEALNNLKAASDEGMDPDELFARFEEGKPADPTKNMSPEDAKKWRDENEKHKNQFKAASGVLEVAEDFDSKRASKTARAPSGLYGFTKQTQNDCETASRAVQRAASRIARRIYAKDQETAPFLSTHSRRGKSMAAKILTAAMGDIGPKVAAVKDRFIDMDGKSFDVGSRVEHWPTPKAKSWTATVVGVDGDKILVGDEKKPVPFTKEKAKKYLRKVGSTNPAQEITRKARLAELRELQGFKVASFNSESDRWFDKLVESPSGSELLLTVANKRPTIKNYEKFKFLLSRARGPWVPQLKLFVENMDAGKYRAEFRRFEGQTSQISELFSNFRQGATYLSDLGEDDVGGEMELDIYASAGKTAKAQNDKRLAARKDAGSGDANAKYLNSLSPQRKNEILKSMAKHYGISTVDAEEEITDRDADALYEYLAADHSLAISVLRDFRRMHLASDKTAKSREYGMYGYQARTVNLGLSACMEVKEQAGRVAARLHGRKASQHESITGFFQEHSKKARCLYSRLLHQSYPEADRRCASAAPRTVEGWLAWED